MGAILNLLHGLSSSLGGVCGLLPQCEYILIGLKIVVLLFLVSWVRNHLGGGLISTVVLLVVGYLVLFQYWFLFGPLAIIYLLAIFGGLGLITSFMFAKDYYFPGRGGGEMGMGPGGMPMRRGE